MTTKKNLVKSMFMNILTAGVFSFGFAFTACSADDDLLNENPVDNSQEIKAIDGEEGIKKPIGLVYTDFITPYDVQILNADTTEIAISKALADKLGINDFVNHPMGIWQSLEERAYLRKPTAQKLVNDKYILTVVPSGLGEVLVGQDYDLSTSIYLNPNAGSTRSADGSTDKYTDSNNMLHPCAVSINSRVDGNGNVTRSSDGRVFATLTAEQIMAGQSFNGGGTRWFYDDAKRAIKNAIEFIDNVRKNGLTINGEDHGKVLNMEGEITPPDIHATFGKEKGDTITIKSKVPYNISLDYTLKLKSKVGLRGVTDMVREWTLNPIKFNCNYFEGRLDGDFSIAPQMTIGIGGKAELPKKYQDFKLCDLDEIVFTFMAGVVPVAIVVQPHLDLHVNAAVGGKIYTGVKYEYANQFSVGMKYQNGWKPINEYKTIKNEFSFIKPTGSFSAEAEAGVTLGCDVLVDGLVGPTLSVGPMFKAGLEGKVAPFDKVPFTFEAGVKAGIYGKAGATLKLWKIELLKWETGFNFGPEWEIWSYKYPNGNNKGGSNKLLELVEEMRQQALSEIEAKTSQAFNEITR